MYNDWSENVKIYYTYDPDAVPEMLYEAVIDVSKRFVFLLDRVSHSVEMLHPVDKLINLAIPLKNRNTLIEFKRLYVTITVGKQPALVTHINGGEIEQFEDITRILPPPEGFRLKAVSTDYMAPSCIHSNNGFYYIMCRLRNEKIFTFVHAGGAHSAYVKIDRQLSTFPVLDNEFPHIIINGCEFVIDHEIIRDRLFEDHNNAISVQDGYIHIHGNRNGYFPAQCAVEVASNILTIRQPTQPFDVKYFVYGAVAIERLSPDLNENATTSSLTDDLTSSDTTPLPEMFESTTEIPETTEASLYDSVESATAIPKYGIVLIVIAILIILILICVAIFFLISLRRKSKSASKDPTKKPERLPKSNYQDDKILSKSHPPPNEGHQTEVKSPKSSVVVTPEPLINPLTISPTVDKDVTPKDAEWFYRNAFYAPVGRNAKNAEEKPFVVRVDQFWDLFPFKGGMSVFDMMDRGKNSDFLCQFRDLTLEENSGYCNFVKRFHEPFAAPESNQKLFKAYILQHDPPSFELHYNGVGPHYLNRVADCKRCANYNTGVNFVPVFKSIKILTVVEQLKLLPRGWHFYASLATTDEIADDSGRLITVYLFRSSGNVCGSKDKMEETKGCYHNHTMRLFPAKKKQREEHREFLKQHAVELTADGKVKTEVLKARNSLQTDVTQDETHGVGANGVIKTIDIEPTQTVTKDTQTNTYTKPSMEPVMR
uniref:Uncharacterized protein n=1 Tax=Panagrellus redivivus TaxID=6233 RepID=A0A7E4V4H4_PANRE